jgi:hypothetical protein
MQTLFIISVLCFLVLIGAGIAIARRIYLGPKRGHATSPSQHEFAQHLFAAAEDGPMRSSRPVRQQNVRDIAANKSWNSPPAAMHILPASEPDSFSLGQERRKAPKAAHHGASKRLDWKYFKKDAGDLSDPYQPRRLRTNSGVNATSPKHF